MQAGQQEAAEEEHEYHGTRVCEEKDRKEASVAELQAEVVKKYDDIRALSAAIANKERDIKDLNARMTHGRRAGAESSLRDAGDMGNNGIDGVFVEIPDRRRTIALSGVQGRVVGAYRATLKQLMSVVTVGVTMCYRQRGPVTFCPRGRVGTGGYEEPQGQEGISD